jgi:hypothetical protein
MAVQGIFASDNHIVGNRIMPEGQAPLFALSAGMESADAQDIIVTWFEENHITGRTNLASFVTDGNGTQFNIDDASSYIPGVILLNERTGEYVLITAVDLSNNRITVTRNIMGGGAVTMNVNDKLQRIGTAFEEASSRPTGVANLGYARFNYMQIFRNSWDVSGTARVVSYYVANPVAKNKKDCAFFHSEDIERSMIWGKKTIGTLNNKPFRTADGMYSMISTNITIAGATTSYDQLDLFFQNIFSKNIQGKPNERILFLGNKALGILNRIALNESQMTITPGQTDFGMNVHKWITPYGTLMLKTHPLFTESPLWTGDMLILHPGAVRTRYLRRTSTDDYDKDGSRAGVDADFGVYTTEMSFEYLAEVTGGIFKGMIAAAP